MASFAWTTETTAVFKQDLAALSTETAVYAQDIVRIGYEIIDALHKYPYPSFLQLVDDCASLLVTRSRAIAWYEERGRKCGCLPEVQSELRRMPIKLRELINTQEARERRERVADMNK